MAIKRAAEVWKTLFWGRQEMNYGHLFPEAFLGFYEGFLHKLV